MNHPLDFFKADIDLTVSSLCKHVRNQAYEGEKLLEAHFAISQNQILSNELGIYIHYHKLIITALEKHLAGQPFDEFPDGENPQTIYQYCRDFFERAECPLGSATEDLQNWVESYADRQNRMSQAFDRLFSETTLAVLTTDQEGKPMIHTADKADKFQIKTKSYLNNIVLGNSLGNYNEQMRLVYAMLLAETPIANIYTAMQLAAK